MTAGMEFEALNHAGDTKTDLIVILNDNEMSISENVGGLSRYLYKLRTENVYQKVKEDMETIVGNIPGIGKMMLKTAEKAKDSVKYFFVPGMFFEELGFKYYIGLRRDEMIQRIIAVNNEGRKFVPLTLHSVFSSC